MKRRKAALKEKRSRLPEAQEDLNATGRAVYGVADAGSLEGPASEPESVEDPLQDWPENAGEADHWLRSHRERRDEEREA